MFDIKKTALVATFFVHFRDASTNARLYVLDGEGKPDPSKPIGVKVCGPGSYRYRQVQGQITTDSIKAGKKGLTGESLRENQVRLLAGTVTEFVNFEYEGRGASAENNAAFFGNVELVHYKEQTEESQADLGNFLPTAASA